jgi:hypothetical protein
MGKHFHVSDEFIEEFVAEMKRKDEERKSWRLSHCDVDKILDAVDESGVLDDEPMGYRPEEYSITLEEFQKFYDYLNHRFKADENAHSNPASDFPEYRMYFEYNGRRFIWRMMHGQGTCCQILQVKDYKGWPECWPMVFEEERKIVLEEEKMTKKEKVESLVNHPIAKSNYDSVIQAMKELVDAEADFDDETQDKFDEYMKDTVSYKNLAEDLITLYTDVMDEDEVDLMLSLYDNPVYIRMTAKLPQIFERAQTLMNEKTTNFFLENDI